MSNRETENVNPDPPDDGVSQKTGDDEEYADKNTQLQKPSYRTLVYITLWVTLFLMQIGHVADFFVQMDGTKSAYEHEKSWFLRFSSVYRRSGPYLVAPLPSTIPPLFRSARIRLCSTLGLLVINIVAFLITFFFCPFNIIHLLLYQEPKEFLKKGNVLAWQFLVSGLVMYFLCKWFVFVLQELLQAKKAEVNDGDTTSANQDDGSEDVSTSRIPPRIQGQLFRAQIIVFFLCSITLSSQDGLQNEKIVPSKTEEVNINSTFINFFGFYLMNWLAIIFLQHYLRYHYGWLSYRRCRNQVDQTLMLNRLLPIQRDRLSKRPRFAAKVIDGLFSVKIGRNPSPC